MDNAAFDALVVRLEGVAASKPKTYVALAVGVAALGLVILGFAVGLALFGAAAVGVIAFLIVTKIHIGAIAVHAFKLLLLLLIPAYTMIKTSITLLFARFPAPDGRALSPAEAPELFAALERLRRTVKGPAVHKVLLDGDLNAAIVQHPRFGLFGWEENILILGMPLLQVLSEDEALSVVAHEYGHLSGHHSRLGGFVYRFRSTWRQLQELSSQWRDWGSRLIARLFRWYAPYFNAYTFVLARQNEYLADRTAPEVAGVGNTARALMRISIAALYERKEFRPEIQRRAGIEPEPIAHRSALWQESVQAAFQAPRSIALLAQARERKTDHLDTHPALTDRLAAIGVDQGDQAPAQFEPQVRTAAEAWLGPALETIRAEFDERWRSDVAENWRNRHAQVSEKTQRLEELDEQATLTADERWERTKILEDIRPEVDPLPDIETILAEEPDHLPARFRRGALLLERGNEAGIADLEAVMAADREAILPGCEAALQYYADRDSALAERYRQRWLKHRSKLDDISTEKQHLSPDAKLSAVDLEPGTVARIVALLREHGPEIKRAYLARRALDEELGVYDYILTLETGNFTGASTVTAVVDRVATPAYPVAMMIFHLDRRQRGRFHRRMRDLRIEPLPLR
jgi:Zn-dependent protease with chaperone function